MATTKTHPDDGISTVVDMLRARDRITKAQLAQATGLPLRTLSRRLNGGGHWEVAEVFILADYFDVPVSLLLGGPAGLVGGPSLPTNHRYMGASDLSDSPAMAVAA